MTKTPVDIDVAALLGWMQQHLGPGTETPTVERFSGGQSNPTYKVTRGNDIYVMRTKPAPKARLLPSAHAIEREYRIMSALRDTGVPVPRTRALCEDESVIGRAFYLMDFAAGRIFWQNDLPDLAPDERREIYDAANAAIAALHCLAPAAIGLQDFGRAESFLPRQIARWSKQYQFSRTERIDAMERLSEWLAAHVPPAENQPARIIHGDFKLDNLIFAPGHPAVIAVLDWELATLGDPLADLSYHCLPWRMPHGLLGGLGGLDLKAIGMPVEAAYLRRYSERTGQAIPAHWDFYIAYNFFRLASIMQGIMKRALEGTASSARALEFGRTARPLAELGWETAQRMKG